MACCQTLFLLVVSLAALPLAAAASPAILEPVWEIGNEDGYLYIDSWPDCALVYASTFMGDIQAIGATGKIVWSVNPGMSWPELACAPDDVLWTSDGAGIARVDSTGKPVFNTNAFTAGKDTGGSGVAAYVDIETGQVYGINEKGECTWESGALAGELRLAQLLPSMVGYFIVEASDFSTARQEFIGLGLDGTVSWRFDATEYGQMPITGLYPVLRGDGSVLLAPVTSSGEIGGERGEYGALLSLGSDGQLEWAYPRDVYLLSFHPAAAGAVHVVLPDCTIHCVDRDGTDRWVYSYIPKEDLFGCLTLGDGGALVCFSWSDGQLFSTETQRVVRLSSEGQVTGEYLLSQPDDSYWYLLPLDDDLLVALDGDYRLVAFELP